MRANWIEASSATGGTGTLTLADVSNRPNFDDVFGTSGTQRVEYVIEEEASGKFESGIGSLNLATLVLTRSKILSTFTGGTYDVTAPSAVSFGTSGVTVRCAPTADMGPLRAAYVQAASGALSDGFAFVSTGGPSSNSATGQAMAADRYFAQTFYWSGGTIVSLSMGLHNNNTAGGVKVGIYDVGTDGLPGTRLWHNNSTPIDTSTTGAKRATVGLSLPPGWYYIVFLSSTASPNWSTQMGLAGGPAGTKLGRPVSLFYGYNGVYSTGVPSSAPITTGDLAWTSVDGVAPFAVGLEVG